MDALCRKDICALNLSQGFAIMGKFILFLVTFPILLWGGVSSEVFVQGRVGNEFDDVKVKIIDSFNQTYYLEKKYFPKDFVFKQGANFAIEVPDEAVEKIKLIRKKK